MIDITPHNTGEDNSSYLQRLKQRYHELRNEIDRKRMELQDKRALNKLDRQESKMEEILNQIETTGEKQMGNLRQKADSAWYKLQETWNNLMEKAKM
ncbi:MAG: hypothetical protein AB7J40_06030 [Candidatus Altimarinota bacterium]